jgi:hypothetical protein
MAMEIGRYTVSVRQANGTRFLDQGKYLNSWRRFGAWLKVADCWSSDLPTRENQGKEVTDDNQIQILPNVQRSA